MNHLTQPADINPAAFGCSFLYKESHSDQPLCRSNGKQVRWQRSVLKDVLMSSRAGSSPATATNDKQVVT